MNKRHAGIRIAELLVCILLVPILLLSLSYLEFRIVGTRRLKEFLQVDRVVQVLPRPFADK
jgi:hypothetical protein